VVWKWQKRRSTKSETAIASAGDSWMLCGLVIDVSEVNNEKIDQPR
jgi:hypothetical protein